MHRGIERRSWIVVVLLAAVAGSATLADSGLVASVQEVSGNTVTVAVQNTMGQTQSGTVVVAVVRPGESYVAYASVSVAAGQTLSVPIVVGGVTDDINPWYQVLVGVF